MKSDPAAHETLCRHVAARYRPAGRFAYHYVLGKLRRDPVARALMELASAEPFGVVADLGCGRGQFAACLLEARLARSVIGVECHKAHLQQARTALHDLDFASLEQDLSEASPLPPADTVMLIDVLYQLDTAAQQSLLRRVTDAARHRVIIRTADPSRGWRSLVTRGLELAFRRVWPHAGAHVNARPTDQLMEMLTGFGLRCDVVPCWAGTPLANVLIVARR